MIFNKGDEMAAVSELQKMLLRAESTVERNAVCFAIECLRELTDKKPPAMEPELKPCPFCGGIAILDSRTVHGHGGCDLFTWGAGCGECGAQIPTCGDKAVRDKHGIRLTKDGRADAIEAWNRRAYE